MTPERWRQITALYYAAMAKAGNERQSFLDAACAGDQVLRKDVEDLLAQPASGLSDPAVVELTGGLIGEQIGSFRVVSLIGKGGMGEVYLAHDVKLARDVAIKALPPDVAQDPDRLARFRREARILAALNHPNIGAIYGLEESAGRSFLIMELVAGETLAERLDRAGALPITEALNLARQIADALDAAHAKGIIHRDLKPVNVKVTPEGRVKVLDFGLAKLQAAADTLSASNRGAITESGLVMGTPPYMSPEQVRGLPIDQRTDVWSFGCLLYELLSAKRAFDAPTRADTMAAVLQSDPPWHGLPREAPDSLRALLKRCLQKDAARRWQTVADLRAELIGSGSAPAASSDPALVVDGLVVLPLRNLSGDASQEFLADGMTEALIWDLARVRALRVISRTSAMCYKATSKSLPEIARELHVDGVIEGSIVRDGGRVLVRAQLVQASTDRTLWAGSYDRDLKDLTVLQSELARTIAKQVRVAVTPDESRQLANVARAVDPEAYEAYLKGQFHWGKLTPSDLDAALGYFERAREKEPALGEVGIAALWLARQQMNMTSPAVAGPRAKEAALRALDAAPSMAEVHYISALVKWSVDWDWEAASAEFEQAFAIRPNYSEARAYHSHFLAVMDQPDAAVSEMKRALNDDPHNALFKCLYGIVLVFARQYDEAIKELQDIERAAPPNPVITRGLACAFHLTGRFDEALAQHRSWFNHVGDQEVLAALDGGADYRDSLYRAAEILAARGRVQYYSPADISSLYGCAGRIEQAVYWLEQGYERRDPDMPYIRNPITDVLRGEPRFQDLLRRMNFSSPGSGV